MQHGLLVTLLGGPAFWALDRAVCRSKLKGCWCFEVLEYVITCVMSLAKTANVIGDACQSKATTAVAVSKPVWLCVLRPVMGVALLIGKLSLVLCFVLFACSQVSAVWAPF